MTRWLLLAAGGSGILLTQWLYMYMNANTQATHSIRAKLALQVVVVGLCVALMGLARHHNIRALRAADVVRTAWYTGLCVVLYYLGYWLHREYGTTSGVGVGLHRHRLVG